MKKFKIAPVIYYEEGAVNYLDHVIAKKAFIVTDPMMKKIGLVDKVIERLKTRSINYEVFCEVEPNPSLQTITNGLDKFIRCKGELLIAIGGGSVIDASKAIIYFLKKVGKTNDVKRPYFIAIPTTSGTGSEVTSYAVITDTKNNIKIALKDNEMFPDVAILDWEFTKTVPKEVTADTGLDVLTHAIEAFVSNEASSCTDAFAQMAIEYVFEYLLNCYRNGDDKISREKIHNASCMAGMAFENSSLGLNHSLAHAFGGKFKVSHGKANAIFLPYVIKYNSGLFDYNNDVDFYTAKKYCRISKMLNLPIGELKEGVLMLIKSIKVLNKQLSIPITIKEMGISKSEFENVLDKMCENVLEDICTKGNPRIPTKQDIKNIFKEAYLGSSFI